MRDNISGGKMRSWADMNAGDFYVDGTQLDLLAGIEGDGYGTLDLLDQAPENEGQPAAEIADRMDGALFGLVLVDATTEAALFSVVAA